MVVETLNSLAALDYPNYEVVVIVNNTPEAHYSAPVAARCRELGERFKFLDITCTGFKAGALNVALQHTAPDASIIAVLDADYVVEKNWLSDLVPYFDEPKVALVQAPQDHRDGDQLPLKQVMNAEYAGFFDIGMVQRNEDDAIITHGTMCLVRRSALDQVGGWGTDTICEDTELGLRLYEAGFQALYTNHRYGRGMLPDTFKAFKTQRFRWAYGAMQIIRKHWTHMLPGARTLTPAQKFHFLVGVVAMVRRCARHAGLDPQSDLGAGDHLRRRGDPDGRLYGADYRRFRRELAALRAIVQEACSHAVAQHPGRGDGGDELAVDGRAGGSGRHGAGQPAVPAHRKGRQRQARTGKSRFLGNPSRCRLAGRGRCLVPASTRPTSLK